MTDSAIRDEIDLTDCDREPIHIPQAVQPHGFLLVLDPDAQLVLKGAGPIEDLTGRDSWLDRPLADLLGDPVARRVRDMARMEDKGFASRWRAVNRLEYDVVIHYAAPSMSGEAPRVIVEVEQSSQQTRLGVELIARLDAAGADMERAATLQGVWNRPPRPSAS